MHPLFLSKKLSKSYQKGFLFYQKTFFRPQDFQTFVLPSSSLFSFLGHFWFYRKSRLMINSKVYGIILSINWILKTQNPYCLLKLTFDLDAGSIDKVLHIENFRVNIWLSKTNFSLLHWQRDSLAYSMLIIALYIRWSNRHPIVTTTQWLS